MRSFSPQPSRFSPCRLLKAYFCTLTLLTSLARAEDWPCWRGPRGDGSSAEANLPKNWDGETGQGIRWKSPLAGHGHSSPIVSGNHAFITACIDESQERVLHCLDANTGEAKWTQVVVRAPLETKHDLNSFASGTPTTDGKTVYVTFLEPHESANLPPSDAKPGEKRKKSVTPGNVVVAAYDFTGKQLWLVRAGEFSSVHGFCSSPVIYEDLLIVNGDHDGDSYILALRRTDGEVVWKTLRKHRTRSYVTPLIRDVAGKTQMVFSGSQQIVSLNPRDGSMYWNIEGPTEQFVASMVFDGDRFFMSAGFPTFHVMAVKPDGNGDVTESHVVWHSTDAKCYVPSPVVVGEYLLVADDRGTGNCFNALTGERLWLERMGRHFSASLVSAEGLVYFTADDGITKIVRPGPTLDVVAENKLGEWTYASPAISNGRIYLRGEKHLFCIEKVSGTVLGK